MIEPELSLTRFRPEFMVFNFTFLNRILRKNEVSATISFFRESSFFIKVSTKKIKLIVGFSITHGRLTACTGTVKFFYVAHTVCPLDAVFGSSDKFCPLITLNILHPGIVSLISKNMKYLDLLPGT